MSKVMAVELLIKLVNHLNNVRMTNHSSLAVLLLSARSYKIGLVTVLSMIRVS